MALDRRVGRHVRRVAPSVGARALTPKGKVGQDALKCAHPAAARSGKGAGALMPRIRELQRPSQWPPSPSRGR